MTKIGVLGDLHGQDLWLTKTVLPYFKRHGVTKILQMGDFGIWPGDSGRRFAKSVEYALQKAGMTLYVTPGNHDDYDQINALPVEEDGWQHFREHILVAPRGHRWEWEGRSFVSLGGAPSIDRTWLLEQMGIGGIYGYVENPEDADLPEKGKCWWPEEAITQADVDKVVEGGYADIMVAHDAPIIEGIEKRISKSADGINPRDLAYAQEGHRLMHQAARGVMPKLFFAGHYHFYVNEIKRWGSSDTGYFSTRDIVGTTRVVVLDKDFKNYSAGIVDLETLDASIGLFH